MTEKPKQNTAALGASFTTIGIALFVISLAQDGFARAGMTIAGLVFLIVGGGWSLATLREQQKKQQGPPEEQPPGDDVTPR